MSRIGIFGGTFNPVHIAHLILAEHFAEQLVLDKCIFVPAAISPFKDEEEEQDHSAIHRLEMLRLATEDNPSFEIDTYEIDKGGISYTYETLKYFSEKYINEDIYLLIGGDHAPVFTKWSNWQEILKIANLVITGRPESDSDQFRIQIDQILTAGHKHPIWLDAPLMEISATEIRERFQKDKSIKYLTPPQVEKYISDKNLYK